MTADHGRPTHGDPAHDDPAHGGPDAERRYAIEQVGGASGIPVDGALAAALGRLLAQLYGQPVALDREELAAVAGNPANRLLVARDGARILGTVTVVLVHTFRGPHARIEDVVVDEQARGRGVGAALLHAALELATSEGAEQAELTSRPQRTAAQRLYPRVGFELAETNVYRRQLRRR